MRFSSSNLSTPNPFDPLTDAYRHRKSNPNASSFVAHASGCADTHTSVHGRMGAVAEFHQEMNDILLSKHAEKRCRQRHISWDDIWAALNRGKEEPLPDSHYKYTYKSIVAVVRVTNRRNFWVLTCYREGHRSKEHSPNH
jgi:hypothetical protein